VSTGVSDWDDGSLQILRKKLINQFVPHNTFFVKLKGFSITCISLFISHRCIENANWIQK